MLKIVVGLLTLLLSLSSSALFADEISQAKKSGPKIFIGVDYFDGETNLDRDFSSLGSQELDIDVTGYRLKFGVQIEDNIRVQGFIKIEDLDEEVFALSADGKIYGIGGEAQLMIPVNPNFSPYVLVGLSSDFTELDDPGVDYSEDTINGVALKAGVGALFRFNDYVELQAGWNIQYRTWQDIEFESLGTVDLEQEDISQTFLVGLNFFF
tara:strand:- start:4673 stop:5302 length:630 start_codon:yes stop_codon:yes gene_type:complete